MTRKPAPPHDLPARPARAEPHAPHEELFLSTKRLRARHSDASFMWTEGRLAKGPSFPRPYYTRIT